LPRFFVWDWAILLILLQQLFVSVTSIADARASVIRNGRG